MLPISINDLMTSENIVHVAALFYLSGFLFRNPVVLRSLIIVGDIVYCLYFYFAPDVPLWGGIFWSALFTLVNAWMIWLILRDRMHFNLSAEERKLFTMLGGLTPGQFRKFVALGKFENAPVRKPITREGRGLDKLYFVLDGNITITKRGKTAFTDSKTFIGEDAFLLAGPTAASVTLEPGAHYFVWNVPALRKALEANGELHTALIHVLNRKLVHKVITAGVLTDTVVLSSR